MGNHIVYWAPTPCQHYIKCRGFQVQLNGIFPQVAHCQSGRRALQLSKCNGTSSVLDPQANSVAAESRHQQAVFAEGIDRNLRRGVFAWALKEGGVIVYRTEAAGKDIGDRGNRVTAGYRVTGAVVSSLRSLLLAMRCGGLGDEVGEGRGHAGHPERLDFALETKGVWGGGRFRKWGVADVGRGVETGGREGS